jgi:hypothetical protein
MSQFYLIECPAFSGTPQVTRNTCLSRLKQPEVYPECQVCGEYKETDPGMSIEIPQSINQQPPQKDNHKNLAGRKTPPKTPFLPPPKPQAEIDYMNLPLIRKLGRGEIGKEADATILVEKKGYLYINSSGKRLSVLRYSFGRHPYSSYFVPRREVQIEQSSAWGISVVEFFIS